MTIEEKVEYLREQAMEEARIEADNIVKRHTKTLTKVLEQHKEEALHQSETRIKAEHISARQHQNMASSRAALELKREYGVRQKELKKQLFGEIRQKLDDFMKTEKYKEYLVDYIEKAARYANGEEMTIYINPSDEDKKAYLEEHTGMELKVSKEDFIGGVRAVIHKRNVLIDHGYKGALEQEYQDFQFEGGVGIG